MIIKACVLTCLASYALAYNPLNCPNSRRPPMSDVFCNNDYVIKAKIIEQTGETDWYAIWYQIEYNGISPEQANANMDNYIGETYSDAYKRLRYSIEIVEEIRTTPRYHEAVKEIELFKGRLSTLRIKPGRTYILTGRAMAPGPAKNLDLDICHGYALEPSSWLAWKAKELMKNCQ